MAMVWLTTKQEYDDDIANMDLRWAGEKVSSEDRDEDLSLSTKMVRTFQRSLAGQLSNPDDKAEFHAKLYEN